MSLLIKGKFIRLEHGESIKILNATGSQTLDLINVDGVTGKVKVLGAEVGLAADISQVATAAQAAIQAEANSRVDADNAFEARIGAAATQEAGEPVVPGIASLGLDGKIPSTQLPALALTDVRVVTNIAQRDALVVEEGFEEGDVAVVTAAVEIPEGSGQFFPRTYIRGDSSWIEISSGSDVTSVNGETGAVVLTAGDIDLETNTELVATTVQGALEELAAEADDIQTELDATQLGAGLETDGTYEAPSGSTYLASASSLKDADSKLDVAIKDVQDELDDTQVGAGLGGDGSYSAHASSNYIKSSDFTTATLTESLHNADKLLDAAVNSVSDALSAHLANPADAHDASAISFEPAREESEGVPVIPLAGALTATTVQAAIEELASVVHKKEKFVLVQADIDNGYVDLMHKAMEKSTVASVGRLMIQEGDDYTLTVESGVTRLTFTGDLIEPGQERLAANDVIYVKYMYKA